MEQFFVLVLWHYYRCFEIEFVISTCQVVYSKTQNNHSMHITMYKYFYKHNLIYIYSILSVYNLAQYRILLIIQVIRLILNNTEHWIKINLVFI